MVRRKKRTRTTINAGRTRRLTIPEKGKKVMR